MRRGRSERREVGLGLEGLKGSWGHAKSTSEGLNVGTEKAAAFVCKEYEISLQNVKLLKTYSRRVYGHHVLRVGCSGKYTDSTLGT
jgi:hypothetical protein